MKKYIQIITLVAVIGFVMAGCGDGGGGNTGWDIDSDLIGTWNDTWT